VVGTAGLPTARLFTFGDRDGQGPEVRLQHPLGVVHVDGRLYVADTYNNKIKQLDPRTRSVQTIAGSNQPGYEDGVPGAFDEPAGISYAAGKLYVADTNNHQIRTIDLAAENRVATLSVEGLEAPQPVKNEAIAADFSAGRQVKLPPATLRPISGRVTLQVKIDLPAGHKLNPLAPQEVIVRSRTDAGPVDRQALGKPTRREKPATEFSFELPVSGPGSETLTISTTFYYCREGAEGLCKVDSVTWALPLRISPTAAASSAQLVVRATE
jgi:hypothetical protein